LCYLLALQCREIWMMGMVIFFSMSNLALAGLKIPFF